MRVTVQEKLVVIFWELIPMESGYDNSAEKDTDKVIKENEESTANQERDFWRKEENWSRLNKYM